MNKVTSTNAAADRVYDVIGIGIGPFNLGLAALLEAAPEVDALFFDRKPEFQWHAGMLLDGTTLQVPFFADLVTMADPTHRLSFLNYLKEQGRLYHFYFLEKFQIPRQEYNHYCQWAAGKLESCRFGQEVTAVHRLADGAFDSGAAAGKGAQFAVEVRNGEDGSVRLYYTRDLVLGVGSVPHAAAPFRGLPGEDVFHSAQFMDRLERCRQAKSVTVIGSGQSAAEIFLQLLLEQPEKGYKLDWFTRSSGFFPMEYSKLGLEHFSPDYTSYFYGLPQEQKDAVRSRQALLYKGISAVTIAAIYERLYEMSVGGVKPPVRLLAHTEVRGITPSETPEQAGYTLDCCHLEQECSFQHASEVIVLATGYAHPVPACMDSLKGLVSWDDQDRYTVESDYRLKLTEPIEGRIFVQNGELHTHGVGAPDLGLGAFRNSVILNALTGREVYPVSDRNVFQQFGAR
ncbi:lysine N(6)-hydroxylase/L-ornithine N(5)-oxygenase family protein [Paenibacillus oenotherae]|uniref:L-lysine N6-monooxygenase MbtG n=1 Tax=Paenibacillus oenotherae TaxID=1435645 RepID=A0ABS7D4N1_9BACL|nr:lysine N(6)-hydroxylase/L-ornithine N(5)-oxygenase family protein [Paenibacillus oenotherae]MBW7474902.1 lysine N(6)-hydroxylase/L-ornithine N(5)-oxygenase family protein [Paenibacillus oenotherae]